MSKIANHHHFCCASTNFRAATKSMSLSTADTTGAPKTEQPYSKASYSMCSGKSRLRPMLVPVIPVSWSIR